MLASKVKLGSNVYDANLPGTGTVIRKFGPAVLIRFAVPLATDRPLHASYIRKLANVKDLTDDDLAYCRLHFGQIVMDESFIGNRTPNLPGQKKSDRDPEDPNQFQERDTGSAKVTRDINMPRVYPVPSKKRRSVLLGPDQTNAQEANTPGVDKHIYSAFKLTAE